MFKTILKTASRFRIGKRSFASPTPCPPEPADPNTRLTIIHNGLRIATEETESPLACVSMFIAAGARYETACTNGLTHFIEHFVFKGLKTLCRNKFEETMMYMSAKCMAFTSREMQVLSIILPSEQALSALDMFARILCELNITDNLISNEKNAIHLELLDNENDPKKVVFDYLHATAFQGTPLAQRIIGTSENLCRFDAAGTSNFMAEHYQPYRIVMATTGKVCHSQLLSHAESRFGSVAPLPGCEPEFGPNRFTGSSVVYRDDSMPLAHVAIAFEAPGYCHSDSLLMLILKNVVGSWDRGQFGLEDTHPGVAARGLANDKFCEKFESFYIMYRDVGLWGAYFVADKWTLDGVIFHLQQHWMQLCTMTTQSEIDRGLNMTRLEVARRYDGVARSTFDLGTQVIGTGGRKSLHQMLTKMRDLKQPLFRKVAEKYLYDKCPAVAAMGPTETLPDYNRIRAGQWWIRV